MIVRYLTESPEQIVLGTAAVPALLTLGVPLLLGVGFTVAAIAIFVCSRPRARDEL